MPNYASLSVHVGELIAAVADKMSPSDLGVLAASLADLLEIKKKKSLKFALAVHLWDEFRNAEFLAGFGKDRVDSLEVLKFAFQVAEGPGEACTTIAGLNEAGAFGDDETIDSEGFITALHEGIQGWSKGGSILSVEPIARLLHGFASEMDTFSQLGKFLAAFLNNEQARRLPAAIINGVLEALCGSDDVRDLAGKPEHLIEAVPSQYEALLTENLLMWDGEDSDSDRDEKGHLKGFVCDDDEVEFSGSGGDDSDSSSEEEDSSSSSSSSSSESSDSEEQGSRKNAKKAANRKDSPQKRKLIKAGDKKHAGDKRKRKDSSSDSDADSTSSSSSSDVEAKSAAKRPRKEEAKEESKKSTLSSAPTAAPTTTTGRPGMKAGKQITVKKKPADTSSESEDSESSSSEDERRSRKDKKKSKKKEGKEKDRPDVSRFFEHSATRDR
jgi:hypothetical protein